MKSFRQIVATMSPGDPATSLRAVAGLHRWDRQSFGTGPAVSDHIPPALLTLMAGTADRQEALKRLDLVIHGSTSRPPAPSLRAIASRHRQDDANRFRFLTYNTYLLKAKKLGVTANEKPLLEPRAKAIGQIVRRDYDIAAIYEIFTDDVWNWFTSAWPSQPAFARNPADQDADVACVVQKGRIARQAFKAFEAKGRVFDSDYWSDKGVLLTAIDTGFGEVEIYSSHFFFGGGLDLTPEVIDFVTDPAEGFLDWVDGLFGADVTPRASNDEERSAVKLSQALETLAFFNTHHRKENVAIIVGDFNIDANANLNRTRTIAGLNRGVSDEYNREYRALRDLMTSNDFYDLWMWDAYSRPPNSGYTSRFTDDGVDPWFATCVDPVNDICIDTRIDPPKRQNIGEGRLDYIWLQHPKDEHTYRLDTSRPVRRAFQHRTKDGDHTEEFLSDHLGLAFDIIVSPK